MQEWEGGNAALVIQSLHNQRQPLLWKRNQYCWPCEMMECWTSSTPFNFQDGVQMWIGSILYHVLIDVFLIIAPSISPTVNHARNRWDVFTAITHSLKNGSHSLKAIQKLMIQKGLLAQETSHLLLQLSLFKSSQDFIVLSLDGSCAVEGQLEEGEHATVLSIFDHYQC